MSQNQWQREEKIKRLEEEYAQNLKVWQERKEDMKRRLKGFLRLLIVCFNDTQRICLKLQSTSDSQD